MPNYAFRFSVYLLLAVIVTIVNMPIDINLSSLMKNDLISSFSARKVTKIAVLWVFCFVFVSYERLHNSTDSNVMMMMMMMMMMVIKEYK